jgi:hypothetical protein
MEVKLPGSPVALPQETIIFKGILVNRAKAGDLAPATTTTICYRF